MRRATHEGSLTLGDIPCAVLDDGTRVISQRGFARALGASKPGSMTRRGAGQLPSILTSKSLKPFIDKELEETATPIPFTPLQGGRVALGIRADVIPKLCDVWLKARDEGKLRHNQIEIAKRADLLMRGLATVGIIALIDEATGYQYDRPRRDLEEQLKRFLSENLRRWVRTFPADYFKELCRLRVVELRADMKLPQYFGKLTNNLIYRRLAPGLLRKLKERKLERGSPSNKLFQWLSEDIGFREILVHLGIVVGLMKDSLSYDIFEKKLNKIAPKYPETPGLFDDPADWEEPRED